MDKYIIELNQDEVDSLRIGIGSIISPMGSIFTDELYSMYKFLNDITLYMNNVDQRKFLSYISLLMK